MSILVVDDSRVVRLMLTALLNAAGHADVLAADSVAGAFALLGVDGPAAEAHVDLILMDITMPGVDGIAAIRRLKETATIRDIPVIVVTGRVAPDDLKMAFEAGAMDYVTKPVHEVELLARVTSALRLKQEMDRRKARERELVQVMRQLEDANRLLQHLSATDDLTGVANRRQFEGVLDVEWSRAARQGTWLSLIMVDIDFFKQYNDAYGHQGGDACLKTVAGLLADSVHRREDMVARYGGEEFALILPGANPEGAAIVAERLRTRVEQAGITHQASKVSDRVTLSLGVASALPRRADEPGALVAAADQALYRAKQAGRNRVERAA